MRCMSEILGEAVAVIIMGTTPVSAHSRSEQMNVLGVTLVDVVNLVVIGCE